MVMQDFHLSYVCRSRFADDTIAQALGWPEYPLIGISLYGHGCFVQCIEGNVTLINHLLTRLAMLPQGFDVQIITYCAIQNISLTHSGTHYLLEHAPIHNLLQQHGMHARHAALLQDIIELFQATHQATQSHHQFSYLP